MKENKTKKKGRFTRRAFIWCTVVAVLIIGVLSNLSVLDEVQRSWSARPPLSEGGPVVMLRRPSFTESFASDVSAAVARATWTEVKVRTIAVPRSRNSTCENTLTGVQVITDADGFSCPPLSASAGCCADHSSRYSCQTCSASSSCCSSYEYCVSCCMGPDQRHIFNDVRSRSTHAVVRLAPKDDIFGVCAFKCRTSSGSVVHENSYRSKQKHCFGLFRPPISPGISLNSDLSLAKEMKLNTSSVSETAMEAVDPYSSLAPEELAQVSGRGQLPFKSPPATYPCRIDGCAAAVPRKYP